MSQEERIMHQLKELHDWTVHANKTIARIMWILSIVMIVTLGTLLRVLFR
jgi:hypothetical protein